MLPPKPKRATREQAREAAKVSGRPTWLFSEFFDDPVGFATLVLGLRLWRKQRDLLLAIARSKKVAVKSGQKTGKSTTFVAAALWWACTRARGRVLLTAPGNGQVRNVLWKELRRVVYMQDAYGNLVSGPDVLGADPAILPATGMQWPDGREIIGFSADTPERMQGFSGPEMLVLIDEGSGVQDPVFEAIDGNSAAGGHIATAGNPTQQSGFFFEAFHSKREFWEGLTISSEETPNVTNDEPPISGLADADFIATRKAEHGETSAFYLIRIKGEFAGTASNAIIGLAAVDAARRAWDDREAPPEEPLEIGLDAARFGDDETMIAPRRGKHAYEMVPLHGKDGNEIAGEVIKVVRALRSPGEIVKVKVDATGGYGSSPTDILKTNHAGEVEVFEVNSSSKADDQEKFFNLRSQLHFGVAQWLKDGGELPPDKKLEVELLAPTYSFDARRRQKVESKDEIKKRLKRSPDRADALALSIYQAPGGVEYDATYDDDLPQLRV